MNGTLTDLNHLLKSDQLFDIPIYQRGYAWEEENLQDLWDDLYYLGEGKEHYFGTILLKETARTTKVGPTKFDHFEVIDGQQRLTTVVILLRELIRQIGDVGDDEMSGHARRLEERYIGHKPLYKLAIGGDDEFFFRASILAAPIARDPKTRAQRRLRDAQAFFRRQFDQQHESNGPDGYLGFLTALMSRIERLQVMLYIVRSHAEAVRMFETVNDRGRPLTNLEKTKSILMYASYLVVDDVGMLNKLLDELDKHFSAIYRCFDDVEGQLGLRDAGEIQRYHHIFSIGPKDAHKYMQMLKDRLVSMSRNDEDRDECADFIRSHAGGLRRAYETMEGIARCRRRECSLGCAIDRLFLIGPVGNLYPLLIAAWQKFGEDTQREEIVRLLEAFVFRVYRVIRYRSDTGRSWLNGLAHRIHGDKSFLFPDFLEKLQAINRHYVPDDRFRTRLGARECYGHLGTRTIKYLLAQYEMKRQDEERGGMQVPFADILSAKYETEHILPQHPAECLNEKKKAAHQEIVHRLGNLTIALAECNKKMGNRPFEEKRDGWGESDEEKICYYRNSSLRVQRDLAKYEEWNESTIQERGDEIIDFALERWRIGSVADPETEAPQP